MSDVVKSFSELTEEQGSFAGGKGGALARLYQAGFPVPDGFVIMPTAFVDDELTAEAWAQVQDHLVPLRQADQEAAYAIRSSALAEDSAEASFAGEFETVLNVRSDEEIRQAIQTVYHSRASERVQAYTRARGKVAALEGGHQIAVVVQRLVPAESSGVLFTANPVSSQRDQAMLSAAWGMGEAIVGGLVTPDTLLVDKASSRVIARETADKQAMTVLLGSGTEQQPVPDSKRRAPVLSDEQAAELVQLGVRIEALYGRPMDIEWTLTTEFSIVQARPITALDESEAPVPTKWNLPRGSYVAMRNNIVELMADPLTPLFRTLGLSAVNSSWNRLLLAFFGRTGVMPEEPIIAVNEYAFYNGSIKFAPMMRIILDSRGIMKRMFTGAVERWTEDGRPRYVETVEMWASRPWGELPSTELLAAVRQLVEAAIDAYGALVSGVIPAAWMSEAWFTLIYKLLKRKGDPPAPTFLMGFDSLPIRAEKVLFDLAARAQEQVSLQAYLKDTETPELIAHLGMDQVPSDVDPDEWRDWQTCFREYLGKYGHTIYNLDFGNPVPADDPAPVLDTFKLFLGGQGTNPYERQQASADRRERAAQAMQERLKGMRLRVFQKNLARAQKYAPLREDGLADVGLSYPLLRQMLRELGRRFVESGMIETPDDIFWLEQDEVEQAAARLDRGEALDCLSAVISRRQVTWRAARRATPPMMLPQIRFMGRDMGAIKAARASKRYGDTLKGVAASPGRITAPASVLHGPEDFHQMQTGNVLVAAITTPAWTPLFVRAAAVVTDVGGPLSHGSIVAREYGIPAVLGTDSATKRIRSGQIITVDGSEGKVYLEAGAVPRS